MSKRILYLFFLVLLLALPATALADGQGVSAGPPEGTFYANDEVYQTVVTPTALPDRGKFDTLYIFPDCADCSPVSDAAPGDRDYNGGRWKLVMAHGITSQLTNAGDVEAYATSIVDTGTRFVCPLIPAGN